jgi:hypothetical protein
MSIVPLSDGPLHPFVLYVPDISLPFSKVPWNLKRQWPLAFNLNCRLTPPFELALPFKNPGVLSKLSIQVPMTFERKGIRAGMIPSIIVPVPRPFEMISPE